VRPCCNPWTAARARWTVSGTISHADHYITEAQVDGKRQRATWKNDISTPSLTSHLAGERYFGVKKGRMTMQVTVEGQCAHGPGRVGGRLISGVGRTVPGAAGLLITGVAEGWVLLIVWLSLAIY
jgi:hypothetical protein